MALSTEVRRLHRHVKQPEETDHPIIQRLFILAHGTWSTMILGQLAVVASFGIAMTSSSLTTDEFFYVTTFSFMFTYFSYFEFFWLRNRKKVAAEYEKLVTFVEDMEKDLTDDEDCKIKNNIRTHRLIYNAFCTMAVVQVSAMCSQPVQDFRLPAFLRGLPLYHPSMLAVTVFNIFVIVERAVCGTQFFFTDTSMVLFGKASLEVLAKRFRLMDPNNKDDVKKTVALHSKLLDVTGNIVLLLEGGNGTGAIGGMTLTLFATAGVVIGVRSPENIFLIPMFFWVIGVLCLLGDVIDTSSLKIANGIYRSKWFETDPAIKRLLLCAMVRSLRPVALKGILCGNFSRPLMREMLNKWYSFLQALLNLYSN